MNAEGVNGEGQKVAEQPQRFIIDGQARPVPEFPQLVVVATRPDTQTLHAKVTGPNGSTVGESLMVVSPDGRALECDQFGRRWAVANSSNRRPSGSASIVDGGFTQ